MHVSGSAPPIARVTEPSSKTGSLDAIHGSKSLDFTCITVVIPVLSVASILKIF